ncbi:MAG: carboxypeptidase-like regulatory domain-containing protein [Ferruginibacter sp.]
MRKIFAFLLLTWAIMSFQACNKDPEPPNPTDKIELSGKVVNRNGAALSGVTVSTNGKNTITDANGMFRFQDLQVSDMHCKIVATKTGYFKGNASVSLLEDRINNVNLTLISDQAAFQADATQMEVIDLPTGAGVQLAANSIQTASGSSYTGIINLSIVHLNPDDADFMNVIPGSDLSGQNTAGNNVQLLSYGMLMVKMTDNAGNELEIGAGKKATFKIPVPTSMASGAPLTIPLWHFDEVAGIWKEEGTATKQGNFYMGEVSHFSSWNCDYPTDRGTIRGRIVDCNGNPLPNVKVKVGQTAAYTDESGVFERFVPTGTDFQVQVNAPELGLVSVPQNVTALNAGQFRDVGDFHVQCPAYLEGVITCASGIFMGYLVVEWAGGSISIPSNKVGNFKIPVPSNGQNATLKVVNLVGGSFSKPVTFPTLAGQSAQVGNMEVCPSGGATIYQSGFTLNGDGFNNQAITLDAIALVAFSKYTLADDQTVALVSADSHTLMANFVGKNTGTFALDSTETDNFLYLIMDNKNYTPYQNGTLTITEYGGVGSAVKGTFNGQFYRQEYDQVAGTIKKYYVTVTNGYFHVIRQADE